jgi:hypothetical protein
MSETTVMQRLRAANPVAEVPVDAPELWQQIVTSSGDPRVEAARRRGLRGWWRSGRAHRSALLACGVLVAACGSAGVAKVTGVVDPFAIFAHDTPAQLFDASPGYESRLQPKLVAGSVRLVETFSVPRVGTVQYWTARNVKGWACSAFKLPNGEWAGTLDASSERYGFAGTVPGCHGPWITWEGPYFHYDSIWLGLAGSRPYGILYGTARTAASATEVRDLLSGATARVVQGGYFVLLIPARGRYNRIPYVHLEALDADRHVLAIAPADHITFGP